MNTKAIAEKHGVSETTVNDLLAGLRRTHGKQVQFATEELGGMGQWSNGMTQIGRMNNADLKVKVNALCTELAQAIAAKPEAETPKCETRGASSAGSQNGIRYAHYADKHRLEIEQDGKRKVYDTGGHAIIGTAQGRATGKPDTLRFSTASGDTVGVEDFEPVAGD